MVAKNWLTPKSILSMQTLFSESSQSRFKSTLCFFIRVNDQISFGEFRLINNKVFRCERWLSRREIHSDIQRNIFRFPFDVYLRKKNSNKRFLTWSKEIIHRNLYMEETTQTETTNGSIILDWNEFLQVEYINVTDSHTLSKIFVQWT